MGKKSPGNDFFKEKVFETYKKNYIWRDNLLKGTQYIKPVEACSME